MSGRRHQERHSGDTAQARFPGYAEPLVREALMRAERLDAAEDDFHKLRVALRRLRTLLWAWRPLLEPGVGETARAYLKHMASVAGDARNWDIAAGLLENRIGAGTGERLAASRDAAREAARAVLSGADFRQSLRAIRKQVNSTLNTSRRRDPIGRFARERVDAAQGSLHKRMRRASKAGRRNYTKWHDVRKAAKKFRYVLEFFGPRLAWRRTGSMKSLKKIQNRFGALNDVVSTEQLLADHREVFDDVTSADAALAMLKKQRKRRRRAAAKLLA